MKTFRAKVDFWIVMGPYRQMIFMGTLIKVPLITLCPCPEFNTTLDYWDTAEKYWEEIS